MKRGSIIREPKLLFLCLLAAAAAFYERSSIQWGIPGHALPLVLTVGVLAGAALLVWMLLRLLPPWQLIRVVNKLRAGEGRTTKLAQHPTRLRWLPWPRRQPGHWVLWFRLPADFSFADLAGKRRAVEDRLGCRCYFEKDVHRPYLIRTTLVTREPIQLSYDEGYRRFPPATNRQLQVLLGVTLRWEALLFDFATAHTLLTGGLKGTGKSSTTRAIICGLAERNRPDQLQFLLIDPAGGRELNTFDQLPHLWERTGGQVIKGRGSSIEALAPILAAFETVEAERQEREQLLEGSGLKTWESFCQTHPAEARPALLVMIEEARLLSPAAISDREIARARGKIMALATDNAMLGRAVRIYMVASTQRPSSKALPTEFKSQLDGTLGFRVRSGGDSRILFDEDTSEAAELVEIPGRAIFQLGTRQEEVQTLWLDPKEALAKVDALQHKYGPPKAGIQRPDNLGIKANLNGNRSKNGPLPPDTVGEGTRPLSVASLLEGVARVIDPAAEIRARIAQLPPEECGMVDGRFYRGHYMASLKWRLVKQLLGLRSKGVCERCHQARAEQADHLSYDHLGSEEDHLDEVQDICRPCHEYRSGVSRYDPAAQAVHSGVAPKEA